jgi:Fimbrial assembly protein (PilN).
MIRKAFQQVQKKQRRTYGGIVAVVALVAVAAAGYAYYGHRQMAQQQAVAQDLFYTMKSLDMDIADVERRLATSGAPRIRISSRATRRGAGRWRSTTTGSSPG